jgi:hypothetical protein
MNPNHSSVARVRLVRAALRHQHRFRPGFPGWLRENGAIFVAFEAIALSLWALGTRRYGARQIVESLRYHSQLRETVGTFKLNDHKTPDLVRLFLIRHPECHGLFQIRKRPLPPARRGGSSP